MLITRGRDPCPEGRVQTPREGYRPRGKDTDPEGRIQTPRERYRPRGKDTDPEGGGCKPVRLVNSTSWSVVGPIGLPQIGP